MTRTLRTTMMPLVAVLAVVLLALAAMTASPIEALAKDSGGTVSVYKVYNSKTGERLYTAQKAEKDGLVRKGWKYEGVGFYTPGKSATPVYRLYDAKGGQHLYTTNAMERNMLVNSYGWKYEKVAFYSSDAKKTAVYRVFNPKAKAPAARSYAIGAAARDKLVKAGQRNEGVGFYTVAAPTWTVKFNANGGKGTMKNQTIKRDHPTKLNKNTFTRAGYTFQGWGSGVKSSAWWVNGHVVTNLTGVGKTKTLYAVWKKNPTTKPTTSSSKPKTTSTLTTNSATATGSKNSTPASKYSYQIILPNGDNNVYVNHYFPVLVKTDDPAWKQDKLLLCGWDSGSMNAVWGDYADVNYVKQNGNFVVTEIGMQTTAGFLNRRLFSTAGSRELYVMKNGIKVASKKVTVKDDATLNAERRAFLDKKVKELGIDKMASEYDKVNAVWDYGFSKFKYKTIFKDAGGATRFLPMLREDLPWPFSGHLNCADGSVMAEYMLRTVGVKSSVEYGGYLAHQNLVVTFSNGETWTIDPSPAACATDVNALPKTALDKWK